MLACFGSRGDREDLGAGYTALRRLGAGASGSVWLARPDGGLPGAPRGARVAVKTCDAAAAPAWVVSMMERECLALAALGTHPNLVRPVEARLTGGSLQLVLEQCSGGTLEAFCRSRRVDEDTARFFLHQLVSVLEHLHRSRVAYRDMKLQNVLLAARGPAPRLVLCDLGTARHWAKGAPLRSETFVGTPGFMAPQVLASMFNGAAASPGAQNSSHYAQQHEPGSSDDDASRHSGSRDSQRSYDARKADIWALGALLHYMLHRALPYGYDSFAPLLPPAEALLMLHQLEAAHTWKDAGGRGLVAVSADAQDLLDQLLHPDEDARISLAGVRAHPWFTRPLPPRFAAALADMDAQRRDLAAAAAAEAGGARDDCAALAVEAVGKLFELAPAPAVRERLRRERRCLAVPLDCCAGAGADGGPLAASCGGCYSAGSTSSASGAQRLARALRVLDAEAAAAGLCDRRAQQAAAVAAPGDGAAAAAPGDGAAAAAPDAVVKARAAEEAATCFVVNVNV
ncbi:SAPK1 [Scenedesmus sp. PABB004]|nr:SAPK1 [Scenedesmus sp. PABB004]